MTTTISPTLRQSAPRVTDHPQLRGHDLEGLEKLVMDTRAYARDSIRPKALEIDRIADGDPGNIPWELVAEGAKLGLLNLALPRPSGGDASQFCTRSALVFEEIAAGCAGMATLFGAHALGFMPLLMSGPAFWDGVLKDAAASKNDDRPLIMACAVTEPTAGTDVEHHVHVRTAKLVTRAEKTAGGYLLNGVKHFISNGNVARWITVISPEDLKRPYETMLGFLVDAESPGFRVTKVEHKMGQRASPAAELTFENVFVPDKYVLGRPGDGIVMTAGVLAGSRPVVGGISTGIARGAYERLLDWLHDDPAAEGLLERQQVQLALAQMYEEIHLSRQAYLDAATQFDLVSLGKMFSTPMVKLFGAMPEIVRTNPIARKQMNSNMARRLMMRLMNRSVGDRNLTQTLGLSSMAKAHGSDTAMKVTGMAMEIAGLECGQLRAELEKCMRDAKLCQIYEGTNQLNRLEAFEGLVVEHSMGVLADVGGKSHQNGRKASSEVGVS